MPPKRGLTPNRKSQVRQQQHAQQQQQTSAPAPAPAPANITQQPAETEKKEPDVNERLTGIEKAMKDQNRSSSRTQYLLLALLAVGVVLILNQYFNQQEIVEKLVEIKDVVVEEARQNREYRMLPAPTSQAVDKYDENHNPNFKIEVMSGPVLEKVSSWVEYAIFTAGLTGVMITSTTFLAVSCWFLKDHYRWKRESGIDKRERELLEAGKKTERT
jgi:hypothetical protein